MKNYVKYIIVLVVGIILGLLLFYRPEKVVVVDDDKEEKERLYKKIDSLEKCVSVINLENDSLRNHERVVIEKCTIRIKDIQTLSIDSSSKLLKENLINLGAGLTKEDDTLPGVTKDDIFVLSHDNVKDVNVISEKYKTEMEITETLREINRNDSIKILLFKSEIACKDSIQKTNDNIYSRELEQKEEETKKAKKETRKAKAVAIISGAAAIALGVLNFTH